MPVPEKDIEAILTDAKAYLRKASDTTVFDEIAAVVAKESSEKLLDHEAIQREEDWNDLANQVVGRETAR